MPQDPSYAYKKTVNQAGAIEAIVRHRILDGMFYREHLYGTNEATILPVIIAHVNAVAGTDAIGKPAPFLCCVLRLLEIAPSEEIVKAYLDQMGSRELKYLTAVVLVYVRLAMTSSAVYRLLEPYYVDYRKLRLALRTPEFDPVTKIARHYTLTTMDQLVDDLLTQKRVVDVLLPRLVPRLTLLERGEIGPREYAVTIAAESESDFASDSE
ncbi:hypothetical protein DICA3_E02388 [Diutina catenulata]